MKKIFEITSGVVLAIASQSVSAQTVLAVSSWVPPSHHISINLKAWCSDIEKGSSGRVKCDFLSKPVASPAASLNAVRSGLADVSFTVPAYNSEPLPASMLATTPFVGGANANAITFTTAWKRVYEKHLSKINEFKGVKLFAIPTTAELQLFTTGKEIRTVEDIKGLKIMCGSKGLADLLSALGANPIVKPASQMYELFSGGVVDGALTNLETTKSFKVYPFVKSVTVIPGGVAYGNFAFFMSEDKWKKISKEDQAIIDSASEVYSRRHAQSFETERHEAEALLRANGTKFVDASSYLIKDMESRVIDLRRSMVADAQQKGLASGEQVLNDLRVEVDKVVKEKN